MWIPIINCGLRTGQTPMCYDGTRFNTEEECEAWIEDNEENFAASELAGGIFPYEIEDTDAV